jgi:hypothetical protein
MKPTLLKAICCVLLVLVAGFAQAANLTSAQLSTLKTNIQSDQAFDSFEANPTPDGAFAVADAYNLAAAPDFWVWRTFVSDAEIYEVTTADGTTWSWTIYIARSQAERDAWRQMVNMKGGLNASLANVRQGIADIFSGAGGLAQRTHLTTVGRRKATRAEKLFSTGTGSTASPALMSVEGNLNFQDIMNAMASP